MIGPKGIGRCGDVHSAVIDRELEALFCILWVDGVGTRNA